MKNKLALIVALVLGVFAMLAVYTLMQKQEGQGTEGVPVNVALAALPIPKGSKFERSHFEWYKLPKSIYDRLSENLITETEIEDYLDKSKLQKSVKEKQFILKSYFFSDREVGAGVTEKLQDENRAVSIAVDFVQGVSGLLKPGDHVDLLATFSFNVKGFGNYECTCTLLQDKTILALDSFSQVATSANEKSKNQTEYTSVTLMVNVQEVEMLVHSFRYSTLHLALKKKLDRSQPRVGGIDNFVIIDKKELPLKTHPLVRKNIDRQWGE